ncbi:uncharacterized protein CLUP02_16806 [Colletotrichum lupini]|uniref:Uncharacterized protein n=1 Tax=Colletotrichum lupini TaxID=145971 RepID=A0A9Q8T8U7_9PEZI|nr:uncharacterized protein CLUP02_16806 [Colletotrichum lupini]UQC91272.1 hypothetical protein CLUP02_16806 [Colletotrichum lupini]
MYVSCRAWQQKHLDDKDLGTATINKMGFRPHSNPHGTQGPSFLIAYRYFTCLHFLHTFPPSASASHRLNQVTKPPPLAASGSSKGGPFVVGDSRSLGVPDTPSHLSLVKPCVLIYLNLAGMCRCRARSAK